MEQELDRKKEESIYFKVGEKVTSVKYRKAGAATEEETVSVLTGLILVN